MGPKSLDPDLVDALAAASAHGHYYPPVELMSAVQSAARAVGEVELISQFPLKEEGFPEQWMEFAQWAYLKATGDVLFVVPPPDLLADGLFAQMQKALDGEVEVCCTILPLEDVRTRLGQLVNAGATVGVSYEKWRWRLLRGGTRRKDYAVFVSWAFNRYADNALRGGLGAHFWFAEHRSTVEHR